MTLRPLRLALAAAALAALPSALAHADRSKRSDPAGDAAPAFTDIRRIAHGHASRGRLRHVVTVARGRGATRALAQLEIRARGATYLIDARGVQRFGGRGPQPSGRARVRRRGNRVVFTFAPRLIGSPGRYRWAATVGANDTSPLAFDRAPDGAKMLRHDLQRR